MDDGRNCARTLVIEPKSSSSNYASSPCKNKVEDDVVGSRFTKRVRNLPIKERK